MNSDAAAATAVPPLEGELGTIGELKDELKKTLENRGVLGSIKARIRAEIFQVLDAQDVPKPPVSNVNLVLNELIREYLEYNNYRHSLAVFIPETGQPEQPPFSRNFLEDQFELAQTEGQPEVPLLYELMARLKTKEQAAEPFEATPTSYMTDLQPTMKQAVSAHENFPRRDNCLRDSIASSVSSTDIKLEEKRAESIKKLQSLHTTNHNDAQVPVQSADQGGLKLLPEQGASSMPGDLSSGESITDRTKTDDAVVFGFGLDQAVPKPLAFSN